MKKIFLSICIFSMLFITSCEKYLDVNTDPNNPTETTPNFLLPSIIANGLYMQSFEQYQMIGLITQNIGNRAVANNFERYFITRNTRPFQDTYFLVGSNIPPMIKAAEAEGSPYYVGAGKIMLALLYAHCTDMTGDIPVKEAFQPALTIAPKYDPQEEVYQSILTLLDEGIAEMSKPATSNKRPLYSAVPSPSGDILYNGDVSKWIKLANAIKARQLNHLIKKSTYNTTDILKAIDGAMLTNADDAQLRWQNPTSTVLNSNNVFGNVRLNMNGLTFGRYFIELLNGKNITGAVTPVSDPRLPIMATAASTGAVPGSAGSQLATTAVSDFYTSWYADNVGVFQVITNAEVRFIEAEAAFKANLKNRAYTAYRAGIIAHMDKIGVSVANRNIYLANPAFVPQNENLLTLKNIMEQKYIALFMNPEAWSDLRKYDYSQAIYTGFYYPNGANINANNMYPRRLLHPITETQYNPFEVEKQGGYAPDYFLKPMWFDQP
jgi:Starch-binding associating with outer membrane